MSLNVFQCLQNVFQCLQMFLNFSKCLPMSLNVSQSPSMSPNVSQFLLLSFILSLSQLPLILKRVSFVSKCLNILRFLNILTSIASLRPPGLVWHCNCWFSCGRNLKISSSSRSINWQSRFGLDSLSWHKQFEDSGFASPATRARWIVLTWEHLVLTITIWIEPGKFHYGSMRPQKNWSQWNERLRWTEYIFDK